jgi:sulfotransferase family protein
MSDADGQRAVRRVLYVMGAGHSGSTILGVALGNCEGFFFAGELEEWLMAGEMPRWAPSEAQRFWQGVAQRVGATDRELAGPQANRCIERSSSLLRLDLWRRRRALLPRYRELTARLIAAVCEQAGAGWLVDTSHFPLRARELRKLDGIELTLVYLVRDPLEVLASNLRELSPHEVAERRWRTLVMNMNLWLTQLLSLLVFLSHPRERRIFVRHEDFLADPGGVIAQILAAAGSSAAVPELDSLRVGSPLQGGRLIRAQTVAVSRAGGDPAETPPRLAGLGASRTGARLTRLLQGPWEAILSRLRPAAPPRASSSAGAPAGTHPRAPGCAPRR